MLEGQKVSATSNTESTIESNVESDPHRPGLKYDTSGSEPIVLVPQPTDDPNDPLNWPLRKKCFTLGLVSACTWIGIAQTLANQSGFFQQAVAYHKTPHELSYSVKPLDSLTPVERD